jgi:hypothetical protein
VGIVASDPIWVCPVKVFLGGIIPQKPWDTRIEPLLNHVFNEYYVRYRDLASLAFDRRSNGADRDHLSLKSLNLDLTTHRQVFPDEGSRQNIGNDCAAAQSESQCQSQTQGDNQHGYHIGQYVRSHTDLSQRGNHDDQRQKVFDERRNTAGLFQSGVPG